LYSKKYIVARLTGAACRMIGRAGIKGSKKLWTWAYPCLRPVGTRVSIDGRPLSDQSTLLHPYLFEDTFAQTCGSPQLLKEPSVATFFVSITDRVVSDKEPLGEVVVENRVTQLMHYHGSNPSHNCILYCLFNGAWFAFAPFYSLFFSPRVTTWHGLTLEKCNRARTTIVLLLVFSLDHSSHICPSSLSPRTLTPPSSNTYTLFIHCSPPLRSALAQKQVFESTDSLISIKSRTTRTITTQQRNQQKKATSTRRSQIVHHCLKACLLSILNHTRNAHPLTRFLHMHTAHPKATGVFSEVRPNVIKSPQLLLILLSLPNSHREPATFKRLPSTHN